MNRKSFLATLLSALGLSFMRKPAPPVPTVHALGCGTIQHLTITNGGSGYTTEPTITISGGGGTGATATASLEPSTGQAVQWSRQKVVCGPEFQEFISSDGDRLWIPVYRVLPGDDECGPSPARLNPLIHGGGSGHAQLHA